MAIQGHNQIKNAIGVAKVVDGDAGAGRENQLVACAKTADGIGVVSGGRSNCVGFVCR